MRVLVFLSILSGLVFFGVKQYNLRMQEISLNVPSGYAPATKVKEETWQEKIAAAAKAQAELPDSARNAPLSSGETKPLLPMASLEPQFSATPNLRVVQHPKSTAVVKPTLVSKRAVSDISRHKVVARKHSRSRHRRHHHPFPYT